MSDTLIVKAKIKDVALFDGKPLNVAGDVADALSDKVKHIIQQACKRAKANGRNTVMAKDI